MYGGLGISGAIPLIHLFFYENFYKDPKDLYSTQSSMKYYLFMGFCYLYGLYIYTKKYPEKKFPGIKINNII